MPSGACTLRTTGVSGVRPPLELAASIVEPSSTHSSSSFRTISSVHATRSTSRFHSRVLDCRGWLLVWSHSHDSRVVGYG